MHQVPINDWTGNRLEKTGEKAKAGDDVVATAEASDSGVQSPRNNSLIRIVETDGDVVELAATTANGDIRVITEMTKEGDTLVLRRLHIDGPGTGSLGLRELRNLATDLGRQQGAKRVTIYGGTRTTGAKPGHVPRPVTLPVGDSG